MEKYNAELAGKANVAMIHVSRDQSEDSAEAWAAKEKFPWLTVLPDDVERSKLLDYRSGNGIPNYVLVDSSGNKIAEGSSGVFSKIAELSE